ncbi:MFS transporter [Catenulispora subtropica]|uniref:MFS transporter n=1 Tax=Catenulispora subtropica TaxID=450798 RepID=A0ABN2QV92_9ACTN
MVSVALPQIGTRLSASPTGLQWVVDAYVLVYAALLVPGGTLGDRLGRKRTYLAGVLIFGAGALTCALASNLPVLLAGRALQGVGPALLVPGSLTIVRSLFHDERRRAHAIGLWSTASGLAMAVGPALGGVIVAQWGWRTVFWINVPLAAVLATTAWYAVPDVPGTGRQSGERDGDARRTGLLADLDIPGAVLITAGLAASTYATVVGQSAGWGSAVFFVSTSITVLAVGLFVRRERRHREPLVDLNLFLRRDFLAANLAGLAVFFAFVGAIVYFSIYFQHVRHQGPIAAGLSVAAIGAAFAVAAPISGRLTHRFGPLPPLTGGLLLAAAAFLSLTPIGAHSGMVLIIARFVALGAGVGLALTPMTQIAVQAVPDGRAGMASAVHNALRQQGQVFGVAVLGAIVYAHQDYLTGFRIALLTSGLVLLAAAITTLLLPTRRPRPASGRSRHQ